GGSSASDSHRPIDRYGSPVAAGQRHVSETNLPASHLHPGVAAGGERVADGVTLAQQGAVHPRVLMDLHAAVRRIGGGDEPEPTLPLLGGEVLLLVAGGDAAAVRDDPNLPEVDRLGAGRVRLAVHHAV